MIGDSAGGQNQEQAISLLNLRNATRLMAKVMSLVAFFSLSVCCRREYNKVRI